MMDPTRLSLFVRLVLFVAFSGGIAACIYLISLGSLSDREAAIFGVLVTILSVLASWIITDLYATEQYGNAIKEVREEYRANLRTYALKAAEKVNNLSNELNKLSVYLEEELSYTEYRSAEEELLAKEERIESAIHVIRTLKSVNDTSLSDWEGVIGEELDEQREEKEARERELRMLIEKAQMSLEDQRQNLATRKELENLKRELRLATLQLSDVPVLKRARSKEPKQDVTGKCPSCGERVSYRQRASIRSVKLVPCSKCGNRLVSTFSETTGFGLKRRAVELTSVMCPHCSGHVDVALDNFPGTQMQSTCPSCEGLFRSTRTIKDVEVRAIQAEDQPQPQGTQLTEELIARVRNALPPQPWAKGIHSEVAAKIGVPASQVRRAVAELIRQGIFHHQFDGVVYVPATASRDAHAEAKYR